MIGDYRYSGASVAGRKFAIIRNGDELQRVREVLPHGNPVIWEASDAMTLQVMNILRNEASALTGNARRSPAQ